MLLRTILGAASAAAILASTPALADIANGPDPYADGYGFVTPSEAGWAWSRGDGGTLWAEWDQFSGSSPNTPDIGSSGTPSATLGWNPGTFAAGSGNLYNFSSLQVFDIDVDGSQGPAAGPVTVALQVEAWGRNIGSDNLGNPVADPVLLNGEAPHSTAITYYEPDYASSFGPVELFQNLYLWQLAEPAALYGFDLKGGPHMSFSQAAVDVGPVPLPGAVWLMGGALLAVAGIGRRRLRAAAA